jgi:hypothetical protein
MNRLQLAVAGAIAAVALGGSAQRITTPSPAPTTTAPDEQPLPDINALMRQVESNERKSEDIQKNYLYREQTKSEERDSKGAIKKTETRESEVFWLNGVQVQRTLKKDGKPLSDDELKKENDRIDERVKKGRERRDKADAQGKETDSRGHEELTFSRILELGSFTNPRRQMVNGRPTILVDYTGDPHAKTHNYAEGAFRELVGTVSIDEQDKSIQHLEGRFNNDFKIGGGLVVDLKKGTWFKISFVKINDEAWFLQSFEGDGRARYLLFANFSGNLQFHTSDYRKFKATSTVLPAFTTVDPDAPTADPPLPPKPPVVPPPPCKVD